jgi:hypothetical protein
MINNLYPIYRYLRSFLIAVIPVLLILFSITIRLPDAGMHKESLKNSSFYNDLSVELKTYEPGYDPKNAFTSLLFASTFSEYSSPGWLQTFFEKNIDLITSWLRDDSQNLSVFVPSQDIKLATNNKIDIETKEFAQKYYTNIPTCTETEAANLKNNGFEAEKNFCLPLAVKDGNQTLSQFFGFDFNSTNNQGLLNSVIKSDLSEKNTESFSFDSLFKSEESKTIYNWLTLIRNWFVFIRNNILFALLLCLAGIIAIMAIAHNMGKKALSELRKILVRSAATTFIIAFTIILVIGGASYLTSSVRLSFLPGFSVNKIASILTWQITLFSFNIVSTAIYIAITFILISVLSWFVDKIGLINQIKKKNQKLVVKKTNSSENKTLDGQFQRATFNPDPNKLSEFQNKDIAENFTMPFIRSDYKSITFNYDALATKKDPSIIDAIIHNQRESTETTDLNFKQLAEPEQPVNDISSVNQEPETDLEKPKINTNPDENNSNSGMGKKVTWF